MRQKFDFKAINETAMRNVESVIGWLLPEGKQQGNEWVALNPLRSDQNFGSFKINLRSGRWSDFASADSGGDLISLVAYLRQVRQYEAAVMLSNFLEANHD